MLTNLSIRNAKRQIGEYLIYWISLIGIIALMYAFNSLIFSKTMQKLFAAIGGNQDLGYMIILFSIIIVMVLGWFVSYMMDFMLRKRSREISTYMILGTENTDICKMLFYENLLLGVMAVIIGLFFGTLISKVLEYFVIHLFHVQDALMTLFSIKAAGLTILYFCAVYAIVLHRNRRKIKKVKIIELLNYDRGNDTIPSKKVANGMGALIISILAFIGSLYMFSMPSQQFSDIAFGTILILLCLILFFYGITFVVNEFFIRSKKWKFQNNRMVIMRWFLSKANRMSLSEGIISILFTVSIICVGLSATFYQVMEKSVDAQPFDISVLHQNEGGNFQPYYTFLSERVELTDAHAYNIFTNHDTTSIEKRNQTLEKYWKKTNKKLSTEDYTVAENQYDMFMKYSDYSTLCKLLGRDVIEINSTQYIVHCLPYLKNDFKIGDNLNISNDTLTCKEIYSDPFAQYGGYGNGQDLLIVVPDQYTEQMDVLYSLFVANSLELMDSDIFQELEERFPQIRPLNSNAVTVGENGFSSKLLDSDADYYSGKLAETPTSQAILIILPLFYLSLVICIISIVILAVQLLTEGNMLKKHYDLMQTLGVEHYTLSKTLRKQAILYFALPFIPAIIVGGGLLIPLSRMMLILSYNVPIFENAKFLIYSIVAGSLLLFCGMYFIYAFISYHILKRGIIPVSLMN
ncbi:MAG: ABC transporter permease [Lachnospiraceae bacterium]|nr:ABC transporter permease [Lachnospiraceae bacterium]